MARERMVTRTVESTVCEVMCVNTRTADVKINTYIIGGGLTDEKALLKAIKKLYETDEHKCVSITNTTQKETLYGMPESKFIELAQVLPPRTSAKDTEG